MANEFVQYRNDLYERERLAAEAEGYDPDEDYVDDEPSEPGDAVCSHCRNATTAHYNPTGIRVSVCCEREVIEAPGPDLNEAIQKHLERLTGGHVQVVSQSSGATVEISDGQGWGEYHTVKALAALRALSSEGDNDRDVLWDALEPAEVAS